MRTDTKALALVAEVATILAHHGGLKCAPNIDEEDGLVTLYMTFHASDVGDALDTLELMNELHYVRDVAQMRGFAQQYNIDPAKLESMLPPVLDSQPTAQRCPRCSSTDMDDEGSCRQCKFMAWRCLLSPEMTLTLSEMQRAALQLLIESACRMTAREKIREDVRLPVLLGVLPKLQELGKQREGSDGAK